MKRRLLSVLVFSLLLFSAACQAAQPAATVTPAQSAGETAVLELVGIDDSKTLTMEALKQMPAAEGQAGTKSSTGKITPPELYKGVLLTDLVDLVGGLGPDEGVQVEAKDGYTMTFSADQLVNGNFVTYDPGTGDEIQSAGDLKVLVAYERSGKPLDPEGDGDLRIVIINDQPNQVTDGHWSIKWVRKITVKPMAVEWTLHLEGAISEDMDRATFESGAAENCHQATWKDEKAQEWVGIPLWLLVGRVDDETKHGDGAFVDALADQGYTVEVVAKDGYSVTFDSARVKRNPNLIVAYLVNGNPLNDEDFPLRLVGSDVQKKEGVGAIEKIIVHLNGEAAAEPTAAASAVPVVTKTPAGGSSAEGAALTLSGQVANEQAWSLDELKAMDVVKLTVEHPKKGAMDVEGLRLNSLLDLAQPKSDASKLVFTAADGYAVEVELAAVRGCADCLVAFNSPSGLMSVMPAMESSLWVKDLIKIEVQ